MGDYCEKCGSLTDLWTQHGKTIEVCLVCHTIDEIDEMFKDDVDEED